MALKLTRLHKFLKVNMKKLLVVAGMFAGFTNVSLAQVQEKKEETPKKEVEQIEKK